MRSEAEAAEALEKYADMVKRICFVHLKNHADTEDIFQTVFMKYILHSGVFQDSEHEKAWFIRVTVNACKDFLKSFWHKNAVPLELIAEEASVEDNYKELMQSVLSLPKKYKDVIYLHYYEGYTAPEIARILGKNVNTVYTLLNRGKSELKEMLGGDPVE